MKILVQVVPTCDSVNPDTGTQCGLPQGHHVDFRCSNGTKCLSWEYNPPLQPEKEPGELYGEG